MHTHTHIHFSSFFLSKLFAEDLTVSRASLVLLVTSLPSHGTLFQAAGQPITAANLPVCIPLDLLVVLVFWFCFFELNEERCGSSAENMLLCFFGLCEKRLALSCFQFNFFVSLIFIMHAVSR